MPVKNISPREANQLLLKGGVTLIDVREPDEFMTEHIPQALSIPLSDLEKSLDLLDLPKSTKIIFHCMRGRRGERACLLANQLHLAVGSTLYNIEGGLDAWKAQKLPLILGQSPLPKLATLKKNKLSLGVIILIFLGLALIGGPLGLLMAGALGGLLLIVLFILLLIGIGFTYAIIGVTIALLLGAVFFGGLLFPFKETGAIHWLQNLPGNGRQEVHIETNGSVHTLQDLPGNGRYEVHIETDDE